MNTFFLCINHVKKKRSYWTKGILTFIYLIPLKCKKILPASDIHIQILSMMGEPPSWKTQISADALYFLSTKYSIWEIKVLPYHHPSEGYNVGEELSELTRESRCSQYSLWHSARISIYSFLVDLLSISSSTGLSYTTTIFSHVYYKSHPNIMFPRISRF